MEVTLHTGRTHQIRVHLAHLGHGIVGDPLYGGRGPTRNWNRTPGCDRMMLHAYQLGFDHPVSGERMEFTAPLPPEFEQMIGR